MSKVKRGMYHDWLTDEGLTKLEGWARNGLTDEQIAHNIGISRQTLYTWKKKYPEIDKVLKKGKEVIDLEVESSLYRRAMGFEYEEKKKTVDIDADGRRHEKTENYTKKALPDVTAMIFWLKNRKPKEWRDQTQMEVTGSLDMSERGKVFQKYLDKDD